MIHLLGTKIKFCRKSRTDDTAYLKQKKESATYKLFFSAVEGSRLPGRVHPVRSLQAGLLASGGILAASSSLCSALVRFDSLI